MGRKRTGTVEYVAPKKGEAQGHYKVRVTAPDGSRPWFHLDPGPRSPQAETKAREAAAHFTEVLEEHGIVAVPQKRRSRTAKAEAPTSATMAKWVGLWLAERRRRGLTSARDNESHWRIHIAPVLGHKHVSEWAAGDLRELVAILDGKVQSEDMEWKTAKNIFATATKMLDDAQRSKSDKLRCRDDNPSRDVQGPDRGARREKQFLYPSEVERLLSCDEVPVLWRCLVAVAVYTYLRAGELRVLKWDALDLEHEVIHVHEAFDRRTGEAKSTKGRKARRLAIEPAIMPLLKRMHRERGDSALVFPEMPSQRTMARGLRRWLGRAGVNRAELHTASATSKAVTFHDLRSTGLTWLAVRGDDPLRIQQRAGHASFSTTLGYIRTAEELRAGFGEPFPELPRALLDPDGHARSRPKDKTKTSRPDQDLDDSALSALIRSGIQRGGRDSNPRPPA